MIIKLSYGAYINLDKTRKIYPHRAEDGKYWIEVTWDNGDNDTFLVGEDTYERVMNEYLGAK